MDTQWRSPDTGATGSHMTTQFEELIEQFWLDLGGQISRTHIRQVATEAAAAFRGATVTAYIPILLRRKMRERLKQEF